MTGLQAEIFARVDEIEGLLVQVQHLVGDGKPDTFRQSLAVVKLNAVADTLAELVVTLEGPTKPRKRARNAAPPPTPDQEISLD